ncbi:trypsin-like serine protease [Kitasatospora sp. NPDC059646]|uniref:trypsin-like serine protease n=1 Tax=Kitasatospora sp. NPDC059646 TaxID=3346893 RepID=UPI0036AF9C8E
MKNSFAAGGRSVDLVELVPRGDRDIVLARLATPLSGVAPLKAAAAAAASGSTVKVAGFGRTATTWGTGSGPRTTAQVLGTVAATTVDLSPVSGAAAVCAGDTGAPLLNGGGEITGVVSRAWQAGCLGTPASETRTGAQAARLDGLDAWITPLTNRSFDLLNPASGRCLNVKGAGPSWDNGTPIILFDCKGDPNEKFELVSVKA